MFLTVSKRLEFSASRRLYLPTWSAAENRAAFGAETDARFGTGRNYVAFFVFSGEVNPENGMLVNISEIKSRVEEVLQAHFDHKFLNEDHPSFGERPPTVVNLSEQLLAEVAPLFLDGDAHLVACHLQESPERSATAYADGTLEENRWMEFSAARQTMSPRLSDAENQALFGRAASPLGHGHHYRTLLTFRIQQGEGENGFLPEEPVSRVFAQLREELDHRNLNREVPGLADRAVTTESLAHYLCERVASTGLPIQRVRLHERPDFFAEYWRAGKYFLGLQQAFYAAHRLHAPSLSEEANRSLYGKCNHPRGHGHRYLVEATINGDYDSRSGTLYRLADLMSGLHNALAPWQDKHLDLETPEFHQTPSTGENIVRALWPRCDRELAGRLTRLRLWETPNNRFTWRR